MAQGTPCRLGVGPIPTGDQLMGRNSRTMVSISRGHSRTCGRQEDRRGREAEGQEQAHLVAPSWPPSLSPLWLPPGNGGPGGRARPGCQGLPWVLDRIPPGCSAAVVAGWWPGVPEGEINLMSLLLYVGDSPGHRVGRELSLYLDDIMSGQVRWGSSFLLWVLALCLFSWWLFILILIVLVLLAGHQREHQCSMVPREGSVQELLP